MLAALEAADLIGVTVGLRGVTETLAEMKEQSRSMLNIGLSDWLEDAADNTIEQFWQGASRSLFCIHESFPTIEQVAGR